MNLIHHLNAVGEKIVVYDNYSTAKKKYQRDLPKDIKFIEGDVLDLKELKKAARACDYVVHLAAQPSVLKSVKDPTGTMEINAMGTLNALLAAHHAKVKRFIKYSVDRWGAMVDFWQILNEQKLAPGAAVAPDFHIRCTRRFCRVKLAENCRNQVTP